MNGNELLTYLAKYNCNITHEQILKNNKITVVVGMSGGVDSSVCALLLKLQGYRVVGIFMKNWQDLDDQYCSAETDYKDVISVCDQLEIPYYSVNLIDDYKKNVFDHFVNEYKIGRTPNPDILCNREIKFKVFFDQAMELGAQYLATGHYCQVIRDEYSMLAKGEDPSKDQSYFLHAVKSETLNKVMFPVGHLLKKQVRQIAEDFSLTNKKKKDSTGICFIGERDFTQFLSQYIQKTTGDFVDLETNKVLKKHDGHVFYTIGQRKGLGIGGPGGPWFVVGKDVEKNHVYVVEGENHPALYSRSLVAINPEWVVSAPVFPLDCMAKIRYRQKDEPCSVNFIDGKLHVNFKNPQRAIAVGQSVVFYQNDICLGGAIIDECGLSEFEKIKQHS